MGGDFQLALNESPGTRGRKERKKKKEKIRIRERNKIDRQIDR